MYPMSSCHSAVNRFAWLALLLVSCGSTLVSAQGIQLITDAGQKEILSDPGTDLVGARDPDVTIVEYFDYNCPYCKKFEPALHALVSEDQKVAIVYKDWPILSDVSIYAAKSAIAARWQNKYLVAHDALIRATARLEKNEEVDATLKNAGINMDALRKDRATHAAQIDALLERNDTEAHAMKIRGTPGVLVGKQLLPGIVDLSGLKQLVAMSRHDQQ